MEQETQKLSAWDRQLLIRDKNRPTVRDYIPRIFTDFYELHGDRGVGDDGALIGGICRLNGTPVTVLAQVKGRNIRENKASNFAMPHPEGYRKALRLAHQAEKFHRPVICLIDTPGAFCGVEAEERGQGEAIARNIAEFMMLRTPVISVVLGEAGSGGALALGVCDDLAMLENALYSVISPRGCASILWKDASREQDACEVLQITAEDMVRFGVAEAIIPEPEGGAQNDIDKISENIKEYLVKTISEKSQKDIDVLQKERYTKFRKIGVFRFRAAPAPQKCSPVTVWVSPMTPHPHGVQHQLLEENEMAKEEIFDKLKELVVDQLGVDDDEVTTEATIQEDLGADSLDLVDLVMAVEEEFDVKIADEDLEGIKTVGDIVDYIAENKD